MVLSEISKGRSNNLNLIRFIAAVLVIFSHSYPLSRGADCMDPLMKLTQNQVSFGNLSVCVFFFFSGFLINRTVKRGQSGYSFFKARCIRIFPALAVVVTLSAFILGSCVTVYRLPEYFSNRETYQYLLNAIFITRHSLPGVFESNVFGNAVNGALWTLRVEFLCYVVCYLSWKMGLSKERWMKWLFLPFLIVYLSACYMLFAEQPEWQAALRACGIFYCGMGYETYKASILMKKSRLFLCMGGVVLSTALGWYDIGLLLCLPYMFAWLAFGTKRKADKFGEKRELSYGIYLCAFPIQQTITMLFGGEMHPYLNFLLTLPFAFLGGFLLNHFVEKRV